jgi:hypothetical protein
MFSGYHVGIPAHKVLQLSWTKMQVGTGLRLIALNPKIFATSLQLILIKNKDWKHGETIRNKLFLLLKGNYTIKEIVQIFSAILTFNHIANTYDKEMIHRLAKSDKTLVQTFYTDMIKLVGFQDMKIIKLIFKLCHPASKILYAKYAEIRGLSNIINKLTPTVAHSGGAIPRVYNRIFFGILEHKMPIDTILEGDNANGAIIQMNLIEKAANMFWKQIIDPIFDKGINSHVTIAMKIKSVYGNYRNIGKYWAFKPGELELFIQTLKAWWIANDKEQYNSEQFELDAFIFSYKALTEKDSLLKIRSPEVRQMPNNMFKMFSHTFTNFPTVWDFLSIEGLTKHFSKYDTAEYFIKGWKIKPKNAGLELPVVLRVLNTSSTTRLVEIFLDQELPLKLGYYSERLVTQLNGSVSFERQYPDGHKVTISYDNVVKEDARNNMNQMPMKSLNPVSPEIVFKNRWAAYDFETMSKPLEKLDSAGVPHQQLNIISAAFYTQMKSGKEWVKSFYINENDNYMDSKALMRNFARYVRGYTWESKHDLFLFAHNAARFDMVFLLEALIDIANANDKIDVLMNNGKLIQVKYTINGKLNSKEDKVQKVAMIFRDSFLLLPGSLAKLAKQFGVENKGDYPVNNLTDKSN